ncbi:PLP-dependent aminotransferase family protein [Pusillimonas sp. SM2304]|uniref:MocR-like pyridoxine biosynthesis transcription factor PdxR n=1 Tax=Pusillimonas sp. SM2304 TaxID=3073241 RepID=UPI0028746A48|nr:PLP-dependent aminotransferase family protein [Pusillimonas sp. SM2304]MDS1139928.1 PLP-dependent aminotransferase family protein [Pusillimonas sp. SM2304]
MRLIDGSTSRENGVLSDLLLQTIERQGGQSLSRQVYDVLRHLILQGDIAAGTKLTASRALARDTGLSRNTVLAAYEQLQSEGYIVTSSGSGTYVSDTMPARSEPATVAADNGGDPEKPQLVLSRRGTQIIRNAQASDKQWGAFVPGVPDVSQFPHRTWLRLLRRHWRKPDPALLTYAYGAGYLPLRTALSEHLRLARSVRCDSDQVLLSSGIHQSISLIANLLGDSGCSAWIENPAYWGAANMLRTCGIRTVPIDLDEEGLAPTASQMEDPPRFIFVTPSHQYPLGTVMSLARRRMLLEYAHTHGTWIIEDDYDSEFRFGGRPIASLQGLDDNDRVLYLGTFSKTLFPSLRLGYMVVPKALTGHFSTGLTELYRDGRQIEQAVLADFISEGHYAAHIRRARMCYARRQALLRDAILDAFGADWPVSTQDAGMHLVMHLPPGTDDVGIVLAARSAEIYVRALSRYYADGVGPPGLLLGYATVPDDQIAPMFRKLTQLILPGLKAGAVLRPCRRDLVGATQFL